MKALAIIMAIIFAATSALAADLEGTWRGQRYDIELDNTFDDIEGYWGDTKYDIDVSETFQDIEGDINGMEIDIDVSKTFTSVEGELPCGKVDYDYSTTFKEVGGIICGQKFEIDLDHESEVIPTARYILMDEILSYFPRPTRSQVRRFILSRIHF